MPDVINDVVINYKSVGLDKVGSEIKQTSVALDGLVVAATSTEKATASLEGRFKSLERQMGTTEGNAEKFAKVQDTVNKAVGQNPALMERGNQVLETARQRYLGAGEAAEHFSGQSQALLHSIRSVGEQLALGVSPVQALTGQLSHLSYVATSEDGVAGAFKQVSSMAGGWATSLAAMVSPTVAFVGTLGTLGTAAVVAGVHWASAQKDIENALKGIGRQSGVTAVDINQIALATSRTTASSIGEARELATSFARLGVMGKDNIAAATQAVDGLAQSMGVDAADAAKTLAHALADPAKGIDEMEKLTGAYDLQTQTLIKDLVAHGDVEKARAVLIKTAADATADAAEKTGFWAARLKDLKAGFDLIGQDVTMIKQVGGYLSGVGNVPTEGLNTKQQLGLAQQDLASFQQVLPQRLAFASQGGADVQPVAAEYAKLADLMGQVNKLSRQLAAEGLAQSERAFNDNALATEKMATKSAFLVSAMGDAATAAEKEAARVEALTVAFYKGSFGATASAEAQEKYARALDANPAVIAADKATKSMADQNEVLKAGIGLQGEAEQIAKDKVLNEQKYQQVLKDTGNEQTAYNAALEQAKNQSLQLAEASEKSKVNVGALREQAWMVAENTRAARLEAQQLAAAYQQAADAAANAAASAEAQAAQNAQLAKVLAAGGGDKTAFGSVGNIKGGGYGSMPAGQNIEAELLRQSIQGLQIAMGTPVSTGNALQDEFNQVRDQYATFLKSQADAAAKTDNLINSTDNLAKSTDSLNKTNQEMLSPYYTQDPRTSHIGFRSQGMAAGGYVDVPGGISANDNMTAVIPVAGGERIYVDPQTEKRGMAGGTVINISAPMTFNGPVNKDEVGRTAYQSMQLAAKQMASVR